MDGLIIVLACALLGAVVVASLLLSDRNKGGVSTSSAFAMATPIPATTPAAPRTSAGGGGERTGKPLRTVLEVVVALAVAIGAVYGFFWAKGTYNNWIRGQSVVQTVPQGDAGNAVRPARTGTSEPAEEIILFSGLPPLEPGMTLWVEMNPDDVLRTQPSLTDGGALIMRCSTSRTRPSESDLGRLWTEAEPCIGRRWVRVSTAAFAGIDRDARIWIVKNRH